MMKLMLMMVLAWRRGQEVAWNGTQMSEPLSLIKQLMMKTTKKLHSTTAMDQRHRL
jgi:hypothetical protein